VSGRRTGQSLLFLTVPATFTIEDPVPQSKRHRSVRACGRRELTGAGRFRAQLLPVSDNIT